MGSLCAHIYVWGLVILPVERFLLPCQWYKPGNNPLRLIVLKHPLLSLQMKAEK